MTIFSISFHSLIWRALLIVTLLGISACSSIKTSQPNGRLVVFDGPVVVEYLSKNLELPLENYAVGGATSGIINVVSSFWPDYKSVDNTGLSWQLDQFRKKSNTFNPDDWVVLWVGSNDILQLKRNDPDRLTKAIRAASANIVAFIDQTYTLGARQIVVANRTARGEMGGEDDLNGQDLNLAISKHIESYVKPSGLKLVLFDAYALTKSMYQQPQQFGFINEVNRLCMEVPNCAEERYEQGLNVANTYINWDYPHKTTRVHQLMAQALQTEM